jgi:predicted RNA-binding Zn ribbon-like protein
MPIQDAEWAARHALRATTQRTAALVNVLTAADPTVDAVADVLRSHGESDPLHLTAADVADLRAGAQQLRPVFTAEDLDAAVQTLNPLLAACSGPIRLSSHAGASPWHLHLDSHDDAPWGEWFLASSALALAVLVADRQVRPGGVCASPRCHNVFLTERTGDVRRFCSRRCATRERVAAHRRRG